MVYLDIEVTEQLSNNDSSSMKQVTASEAIAALERLNNYKAVDITGLTSKQLRGLPESPLLVRKHDLRANGLPPQKAYLPTLETP